VYWWIALALLSAAAIAAGLYFNRFTVDIEPDSGVMVSAGLRFSHGEGVSVPNLIGPPKPMTWFPPLVPWLVALCERTGVSYRVAFGVFNAIAWGVLAGWTGWLAARTARGGWLAGLFAAGAVATSSTFCIVNGMLYSEPFFLLFLLGALAALACWWERPSVRWAAVAGLCVGGAFLTRYVGITLVATGGLVMIVRSGLQWVRRLGYAALFAVLGAGPMLAWLFEQTRVGRGDSPRQLAWHPVTADLLNDGVAALSSFIIPQDFADSPAASRTIIAVTCLFALAASATWFRRNIGKTLREKLDSVPPLVWIGKLFAVIYVAFLLLSISIADADTPLDQRILCVIIPSGLFLAAWLGHAVFRGQRGRGARIARIIVACGVAGLLALHAISTERIITLRKNVLWNQGSTSDTLAALAALPPGAVVYSNDPFGIYLASRCRTELLPDGDPDESDEPSAKAPGKEQEIRKQAAAMAAAFSAKGGWVVYCYAFDFTDPVMNSDGLKDYLDLKETTWFGDGCIIRVAPRPVPSPAGALKK
jgi:hypothetical protein